MRLHSIITAPCHIWGFLSTTQRSSRSAPAHSRRGSGRKDQWQVSDILLIRHYNILHHFHCIVNVTIKMISSIFAEFMRRQSKPKSDNSYLRAFRNFSFQLLPSELDYVSNTFDKLKCPFDKPVRWKIRWKVKLPINGLYSLRLLSCSLTSFETWWWLMCNGRKYF